jgi:hypothetical protein
MIAFKMELNEEEIEVGNGENQNRTSQVQQLQCAQGGCLYFLSFPPWSGQDSLLQMMRNGEWKRSRLVKGRRRRRRQRGASDSGKMCWKPGVLCAGNSEQQGRWG